MFRTSLPLAALTTLALSAGAQAATTTDYAVTIDGTASYNRADADTESSAQHDIDLTFRTEIPKLTFHGDAAESSRGARATAAVTRGSYVITGESGQVRCTTHALSDVTGGGLEATRGATATTFATRVVDAMTVTVGGCSGSMPDWRIAFGSAGDPVGVGIFDGAFTVPHARIGEDTLTFPLRGEVTGSSCPFNHALTALCSLTWEADVRFVKTGTGQSPASDDDLVVPIVPAPAPAAPPAPPAADDDLLVPLTAPVLKPVRADAVLTRTLTRATLPLTCTAACRGTVTAKAGSRTLARTSFGAAAGRTAVARLRFDAADRRAIRRAGAVRLIVRGTVGGRAVRSTTTLRSRR